MHQTVGNVLRTLLYGHPPLNHEAAESIVDNALATAQHTMRTAASRSLDYQTPGALACHRDMFLNVPFMTDLAALRQRRQLIINDNLLKQNARRRHHDYRVHDQVLVKETDPSKLGPRTHGPYPIVRVHANGNVTIRRTPYVQERLNIRRVFPYRL